MKFCELENVNIFSCMDPEGGGGDRGSRPLPPIKFYWRANYGPLIVVFGSSHQLI